MPAAHKPTDTLRSKVKQLVAVGIPQDDIATILKISKNTLIKHYREEIDTAMTLANAQVAGALFNAATSGNVTAAIFWTKTRMGWKEDAGGAAQPIELVIKRPSRD